MSLPAKKRILTVCTRLFLTMTLRACSVLREETERVMQELFQMLAMHDEFSLAGIEDMTTTNTKTEETT